MKTRMMLLGATVVLLALILLVGCATGKYVQKPNEELYGTWTNKSMSAQRVVNTPGEYKLYGLISDPKPFEEGTEQIAKKWTDSEGNVWYNTFGTVTSGGWKGHNFQSLMKLSKSGTEWEWVEYSFLGKFDDSYYPTKIDPKEMLYGLYYRAGN